MNMLRKVAYGLSQLVRYTDFIPLLLIRFMLICFKEIVIGAEQTVFKMKNNVEYRGYVVIHGPIT